MGEDWSRYWRSDAEPLEAMHAHFERHVYHRHSHDAYSFGVTDSGAQTFKCRGSRRTSVAGMIMAFNPDDPHDGHAADELGFTYRMVHIGPSLIRAVLSDAADSTGVFDVSGTTGAGAGAGTGPSGDRPAALPLFAEPVIDDPFVAARVRALHAALLGGAPALRRDELLSAAVLALVGRASTAVGRAEVSFAASFAGPSATAAVPRPTRSGAAPSRVARQARSLLHDDPLADLSADELAAACGCSRYALYRSFRGAYGMAPGDYQRLLRLRGARRLIAGGTPVGEAAALAGFADQAHLTRWFTRSYGVTPGAYRRAVRDF